MNEPPSSQRNESITSHAPEFRPIIPAKNTSVQQVSIIENDTKIYKKINENLVKDETSSFVELPSKSSILGATFMLTNICLGTTIFTFAVRAKVFGLVWLLVATIVVGIINYWTITRGATASSKCKEDDFSEITEKILGRRARVILNILLILYSYACMMCFLALLFPLFGRFILSAAYRNDYIDYDQFQEKKWGKPHIKFPFFVGMAFIISLMCLIKDINKLNFSAYIGVGAVIYTLMVITIQCHDYYEHYKDTVYDKNDKSTHINWVDLSKAFTKELEFFKGMANLFAAYACHPGIFPIYAGFKIQENGLHKMKVGTFFATCLTTVLHFLSIICSFLTDPITPEDLIIYRKNKGNDKDIAMTIAKLFVVFSLVFTLPGYYFSLRLCIANSFTGGKISNKFNYIFTFVSVFACSAIAAVYDKILNYLSYIGGFISVFVCYLYPILMYVYSSGKSPLYWKNLIEIILAIFLCMVGVTAGILTIIDDVKG